MFVGASIPRYCLTKKKKNMKSTTCYLTVRVEIDYDENLYEDENEAIQETISRCDYRFAFNEDGLEITETEICGINE